MVDTMENLSIYLKSKEFLFSLIYIPIFVSLTLISGELEITFAIISGILILILLGLLIKLSMGFKLGDKKIKFRSFIRFFIFNVLMLLISFLMSIFLMQNCRSGLCGLSEAETMLLFIPIQLFSLIVYGLSLIIVGFFNKK